jgi:hypothetical protein
MAVSPASWMAEHGGNSLPPRRRPLLGELDGAARSRSQARSPASLPTVRRWLPPSFPAPVWRRTDACTGAAAAPAPFVASRAGSKLRAAAPAPCPQTRRPWRAPLLPPRRRRARPVAPTPGSVGLQLGLVAMVASRGKAKWIRGGRGGLSGAGVLRRLRRCRALAAPSSLSRLSFCDGANHQQPDVRWANAGPPP